MGRMMRDNFVDFFAILEQYKGIEGAPQKLSDLPAFERECRDEGKTELADWLENWRLNLEYHISREFTK